MTPRGRFVSGGAYSGMRGLSGLGEAEAVAAAVEATGSLPLYNPYAPPGYAGIPDLAPAGVRPVGFDYVYDKVLAANTAYSEQVSIQPDADFKWMAIFLATATGSFSFRFSDSNLYYLSNTSLLSALLSSDPSSPTPVFPAIMIPAGGRIGIDILDLSGAPNTVQIIFRGSKLFRTA